MAVSRSTSYRGDMAVPPTFVDLQGFVIDGRFVVKEAAVLREGYVLSHYVFASPMPWHFLRRTEKAEASWLIARHHGLRWNDGSVPCSMAKRLITTAVASTDISRTVLYVKGLQKRQWLRDLLDDATMTHVDNIESDYDNIPPLYELSVTDTLRCDKHFTNCAMQNVFKLFNWWSEHHTEPQ